MNTLPRSNGRLFYLMSFLVLVGTAAGWLMVPRAAERQRIEFLLHRSVAAIAAQDEAILAGGGPTDVFEQARLHYQAGDLAGSIALLERLERAEGLSNVGKETLAYYYGENQQPERQYRLLSSLARDHLNERNSRKVLRYYRSRENGPRRMRLLVTMHERGFLRDAELQELSRLYRHAGQFGKALSVHRERYDRSPEDAAADDVRLLVRLLERLDRDRHIPDLLAPWVQADVDVRERQRRMALLLELEQYEYVIELSTARGLDRSLYDPFYRYALFELRNRSAVFADAYIDALVDDLQSTGGAGEQTRILHDLFDFAPAETAYALALRSPYVDRRKATDIYYATLQNEGRNHELAAHLADTIERGRSDLPAQIEAANRIASLDEFDLAEGAFRTLARREGADGASMEGLLYSWHRLAKAPDIDWVGRQLLEADRTSYAGWERRFLGLAEPRYLLDWLDAYTAEPAARRPSVLDTRVRLAAWEVGYPRLSATLADRLNVAPLPDDRYRDYLTLACDNGLQDRIATLSALPDAPAALDPPLHLCIAETAAKARNPTLALRHYEAAERDTPSSSVTALLGYADVASILGMTSRAREVRERARALLPPIRHAGRQENMIRGHLSLALEDERDALAAFEQALATPNDTTGGEARDAELSLRKTLMELNFKLGRYGKVLGLACAGDACESQPEAFR